MQLGKLKFDVFELTVNQTMRHTEWCHNSELCKPTVRHFLFSSFDWYRFLLTKQKSIVSFKKKLHLVKKGKFSKVSVEETYLIMEGQSNLNILAFNKNTGTWYGIFLFAIARCTCSEKSIPIYLRASKFVWSLFK